jgi:hypothetical protein
MRDRELDNDSKKSEPAYKTPLQDALNIAEGLRSEKVYVNILDKYELTKLPKKDSVLTDTMIKTVDNPIVRGLLKPNYKTAEFKLAGLTGAPPAEPAPSLAATVGLASSEIFGGLTEFIVRRFKQELLISFFEGYHQAFGPKAEENLSSLFPTTHRLLSIQAVQAWDYNRYMNLLRNCFQKDLDALPRNLKTLLELEANNKHNSELYSAALFSLEIVEALRRAKYPADAILEWSMYSADRRGSGDFQNALKLLARISENLRRADDGY